MCDGDYSNFVVGLPKEDKERESLRKATPIIGSGDFREQPRHLLDARGGKFHLLDKIISQTVTSPFIELKRFVDFFLRFSVN